MLIKAGIWQAATNGISTSARCGFSRKALAVCPRRVDLTPILGHLILGSDPEEGGPDGSSSEVPAGVSA